MIFADNHDMSRVFTQLNGNVAHTKMALGYILCMPRIPQIYYGTEILMNDFDKPGDHGLVRTDFPGGWSGDEKNAFTGEGLNSQEKEMQSFLKTLLNYRKESKAIHHGKTIHFSPEEGVYVLFRKSEDEVLAIVLNKNKESITLDLNRFSEIGVNGKSVKNIHSKEEFIWDKELNLSSEGVYIITTKL